MEYIMAGMISLCAVVVGLICVFLGAVAATIGVIWTFGMWGRIEDERRRKGR